MHFQRLIFIKGKFFCVRLLYQQGWVFLFFLHFIYLFIQFGEKVQGYLLLYWNVSKKGPCHLFYQIHPRLETGIDLFHVDHVHTRYKLGYLCGSYSNLHLDYSAPTLVGYRNPRQKEGPKMGKSGLNMITIT